MSVGFRIPVGREAANHCNPQQHHGDEQLQLATTLVGPDVEDILDPIGIDEGDDEHCGCDYR